jgi:pimeloyl-ACP methyl ester carboxylesterase
MAEQEHLEVGGASSVEGMPAWQAARRQRIVEAALRAGVAGVRAAQAMNELIWRLGRAIRDTNRDRWRDHDPGEGILVDRSESLQPRTARANGVDLAYLEVAPPQGVSAELVLVAHGFPDTAWSFASLLTALANAGYRAVAPFLRGYPPSAIPQDGDYSALTLGRDVIALAEHLGAPSVCVVGHDWGAVAAYAAAALRPDFARRIVAVAAPHPRRFLLRPTRAQLAASHYMLKFQIPGWAERRIPRDDFAWLRRLVHSWSPSWTVTEAYFDPVRHAFSDPARLRAALNYYRAIPRTLFDGQTRRLLFKPVNVPTAVVHGENDGCILAEMFADSESLFTAEYQLVGLRGIGHFMHIEAPDAFAAKVLQFLGGAIPPVKRSAIP